MRFMQRRLAGRWHRQPFSRHRPCIEPLEHRTLLSHKVGDHIHPNLSIIIDGAKITVPADIGITSTQHYSPHTHDPNGELHVGESPVAGLDSPDSPPRFTTLKDVFDVWRTTKDPNAEFNQFQIMDKVYDATHVIKMTVNGQPNTEFENYSPHDKDQIVITYETIAEPPPPPPPPPDPDPKPTPYDGKLFVIGASDGNVQVRRASDGTVQAAFAPYDATYQGRVSVALGDINGDGFEDVVTGSAVGSPHVKVFDGKTISQATFQEGNPDAQSLASFMAYGVEFNVGVYVAVGEITGGPSKDIVTGASAGNPHVKIFHGGGIADGTFATNPEEHVRASFFAYPLNINLGATVAVGAVSGAERDDVVTGSTGGNPHVKIYKGEVLANGEYSNSSSDLISDFFAFAAGQNFGVNVAVGDSNADTFAEIIVGAALGSSQVKVYNGKALSNGSAPDAAVLDEFFAYDTQFATGVAVGAADFDEDGAVEILTGAAQGSAHYRVLRANSQGVNPPSTMEKIVDELRGGIMISG